MPRRLSGEAQHNVSWIVLVLFYQSKLFPLIAPSFLSTGAVL